MAKIIFQKVLLILFGVFLTIFMLEIGLRIGGFVILSIQDHRNEQALKLRGTYKIMCVGESTTAGQYPRFLEDALSKNSSGIKFSIIDRGLTGSNTSFILAQLESNIDKYNPDMVIAMIGVNDSGDHIPIEYLSASKGGSFLSSLRVCKLTRLLWLHIVAKIKEAKASDKISDKTKCSLSKEEVERELSIKPQDDNAYVDLACVYETQGKMDLAKEAFKKAISINPKNTWAYIRLGWMSSEEEYKKLWHQLFDVLSKALKENPQDLCAQNSYLLLAEILINQGHFDIGEKICKELMDANPGNYQAFVQLGKAYLYQSKYLDAEKVLKEAADLNKSDGRACDYLSILYHEMANDSLAKAYYEKADKLRAPYYTLGAVRNYREIKRILDSRKIRLVAVQYPMRSVEPLKSIFEDNRNIVFVDNEEVFKNAVQKFGYREIFIDIFGGDFGHCTDKGNKLLSENIAGVIVKELTGKRN